MTSTCTTATTSTSTSTSTAATAGATAKTTSTLLDDDDSLSSSRLLSACQEHLLFLRDIHRTGVTVQLLTSNNDKGDDDILFKSALHRYRNGWLPLVSKYRNVPLIPPSDVAWLWHAHRLAPVPYTNYCRNNYNNTVLEAFMPFTFQKQHSNDKEQQEELKHFENRRAAWVTRMLWRKEFPNEPFFLDTKTSTLTSTSTITISTNDSKLLMDGYNLQASIKAQAELLWHLSSGPQWQQTQFTTQAIQRYKNFLSLAVRVTDAKQKIVPCYDVDWVWHTHILCSQQDYQNACLKRCGKIFHHDDAFNDREGNDTKGPYTYQQAWKFTCELYLQVYGQHFDAVPGTLYYGPPAPVYWQYQTWDPVAPWTQNNHRRQPRQRPWGWLSLSGRKTEKQQTLSHQQSNDHDNQTTSSISWRDLLVARGTNLWTVRQKAFLCNDNQGHILIPTYRPHQTKACVKGFWSGMFQTKLAAAPPVAFVQMVGKPSHFQQLEDTQGLDKRPMNNMAAAAPALTQSVGDEWKRQRHCMAKQALAQVKQMSIQAVNQVQWNDMWQQQNIACGLNTCATASAVSANTTIVVDLKDMVAQAVLTWSSGLFGGIVKQRVNNQDDDNDGAAVARANLKQDFWEFWQASRAWRNDQNNIQSTKTKLVASVKAVAASHCHDSDSNGLIHHVFQQDFTSEVASINCVHAMVAASDTTMVLVFWTLYHLSKSGVAWRTCQEMTWSDENIEKELDELAKIKATATTGSPVNPIGLSLLGRALVESARAYPPVWSLPRALPSGTTVQFDVPWANGSLDDPEWSPDRKDRDLRPLATFGVGKRHCPGGTAALWAAHALLRHFVSQYDPVTECQPGKSHESLYLGPTLCLQGPQYFELTERNESELVDRYTAK